MGEHFRAHRIIECDGLEVDRFTGVVVGQSYSVHSGASIGSIINPESEICVGVDIKEVCSRLGLGYHLISYLQKCLKGKKRRGKNFNALLCAHLYKIMLKLQIVRPLSLVAFYCHTGTTGVLRKLRILNCKFCAPPTTESANELSRITAVQNSPHSAEPVLIGIMHERKLPTSTRRTLLNGLRNLEKRAEVSSTSPQVRAKSVLAMYYLFVVKMTKKQAVNLAGISVSSFNGFYNRIQAPSANIF